MKKKFDKELTLLRDKVILLISPQPWGGLYISKNHYAIELSKSNIVYFLCPIPLPEHSSNRITIQTSIESKNLFIINHKLFFPFQIKFHAKPLFKLLMRLHTHRILKSIGRNIDIVWSFDLGNYFPFSFFPKLTTKIFHPVDEPLNRDAIRSAKNADVIFSVTHEILEKYKCYDVSRYFINHGLSYSFLPISDPTEYIASAPLHVGISGNMRRNDIDRHVLLSIIHNNPNIIFDCWGPYKKNKGGVRREERETNLFIERLLSLPNVRLHGLVKPDCLSRAYSKADAFLICYDVNKDQSKGTNYHKVIEFLSTGKVIISNNITTYSNLPNIVQMVDSRENNNSLPALFSHVVSHLSFHNSVFLQRERKKYAEEHTYGNQILRIDKILKSIY